MVCTSVQNRAGKADRMIRKPVSKDLIGNLDSDFDLGQLDRLIFPLRSNGECGNGHCGDHRHDQGEYDNLSHIFLTFVVGSTTQKDGAFSLEC